MVRGATEKRDYGNRAHDEPQVCARIMPIDNECHPFLAKLRSMRGMLTQDRFLKMKEEELKNEVLIPLLKAMGYSDVTDNHGGSSEQGKDIVCWKANELGSRRNLAIAAKAVRLTGKASVSSGTVGEVHTQIQQCFGKPYSDPATGEPCHIHECWVVTNQKIGKEFVEAITSVLNPGMLNRSVSYIDGDKLWELVKKYLPVSLLQLLNETNAVISDSDTHYQPHVYLTGTEARISLHEKYPGAAQEKPIKVKGRFVFPNTPEGEAARSAVEHFFATGTPFELSSEFIDTIELPDFYKQILGITDFNIEAVGLGPSFNTMCVPVRIEILTDTGDEHILPYIELRMLQGGTEEMTLTNDQQSTPIQVKLTLRPEDKGGTLNITTRDVSLNAVQLLNVLELHYWLRKSSLIRVVSLDLGFAFFEMHKVEGNFASAEPDYINFVRDMAAIQTKVKRSITIPERDFTEEEIDVIEKLRSILHTGKAQGTWSELPIPVSQEGVATLLEDYGNGKSNSLYVRSEEIQPLFDTEIPLGIVAYHYEEVILANEDELREAQEHLVPIVASFAPGENNKVTAQYADWLQASKTIG